MVHEPAGLVVERGLELGGEQLPVQVVLVVDGHDREMNLRGPVGLVPAHGPVDLLVALDEVPPDGVEVGVGIRVQLAFEVRDDEHPPREHQQRRPPRRGDPGPQGLQLAGRDRGDGPQPVGGPRQTPEQHGGHGRRGSMPWS